MKLKIKTYLRELWNETRDQLFKRSWKSRAIWGMASLVTLSFAYYFQLNSGHAPEGDPWGNPIGQAMSAMASVGWIGGSFGLVLFTILGLGPKKKTK